MTRYPQILSKVVGTPWLITQDSLKMILEILNNRMAGVAMSDDEIRARLNTSPARANGNSVGGVVHDHGVAILPIMGPIFPKANLMTEMSGATSIEAFREDFRAVMNNDYVHSVVLDIDSPGGMVNLVPEMAAEIREAREQKPVYAVANTDANSAAYYLASQATRMYVTPSGQVGSIGVYAAREDLTAKQEKEGIKTTIISAGPYKAEGNPYSEITDEEQAHLQSWINAVYEDFIQGVAEGRGVASETVRANFGGGRTVTSKDALQSGMVDGIATLDHVVGHLLESGGAIESTPRYSVATTSNTFTNVSTTGLRLSTEQDKEHSEPGTAQGGEPTPAPPQLEGDPMVEQGWRRDQPPIVQELEGSVMSRDQLLMLAGRLGVETEDLPAPPDDDNDDELVRRVLAAVDEVVVPLSEAQASAANIKNFRKDYPEEYEQMRAFKAASQKNDAREFSDGFKKLGETSKGLSAVALDKVEDIHIKVSSGEFTHADLAELVETLADKDSTVDYGEKGSSRSSERASVNPNASVADQRKAFADRVKERMTQDDLTFKAAMNVVANEEPELAEAYQTAHRR